MQNRFREAGGEIYFAPDIRVTHIGGTSQAPSVFIERHKARGFVRYFHKNFKDRYPLPFLWLLDLAIWTRFGIGPAPKIAKALVEPIGIPIFDRRRGNSINEILLYKEQSASRVSRDSKSLQLVVVRVQTLHALCDAF